MATKLDKPLRRELAIDGAPYMLTLSPEGLKLVPKGKRKGLELEGQVLSKAVQLFLDEELVVVEGKVIFKPGLSRFLKESR